MLNLNLFVLTIDQINFVDQFAFKDILCLTIPDLPNIQPFVFLTPGQNNTKEACTSSLDLTDWKLITNPESPVTEVPPITPDDITEFELPNDESPPSHESSDDD